jgi:hypothetical protein
MEIQCVVNIVNQPAVERLWGRRYWSREEQRALAAKARDELLTACAEAWCIVGPHVSGDTALMRPWYPSFFDYPTRGTIDYAGGVKAIRERIRQGGLSISEKLRPWTPSFLRGLTLSGAIRRESFRGGGRWQIWSPAHRELVEDLEQAGNLPKRLKTYPATPCVARLGRCPAMLLPPDDALGPEALAGLLAGAELKPLDDGEWLLLPDDEGVSGLLDAWTVKRRPVRLPRRRPQLAVSPFYACLAAHLMPARSARRMRDCRNPAMGEALPILYWELIFSDPGQRLPPFSGALPFLMSTRTFRRRGIDRSDLHRQAVCEVGLTNVSMCLRELLRRFYREACQARQSPGHTAGDTAGCDHSVPVTGSGSGDPA